MTQQCRIALAGLGGVGRATAQLLLSRRAQYRARYGVDVLLVAACGSRAGVMDAAGLEPDRLDHLEEGLTGADFIAASEADVLIEAGPSDFRTGGPGLPYLREALAAGRDAIVISKGALVFDGRALRDLAGSSGSLLKLSGATAAALPTIDLLNHNLIGCRVLGIEGILNATTNFLLDAMIHRGLGFAEALRQAQAAGFAESDPRNDVEGWDTACKLLILANFGLGADLAIADMAVTGIDKLGEDQLRDWRDQGLAPKLIGRLWREGEGFKASVGVHAYPPSDPFALVAGKNKAIRIATDLMGEVVAMGCGSEPMATAAAALKDFEHILAIRSGHAKPYGHLPLVGGNSSS
ncbi:homoserine dehydrogenase [Novosphingobium rosa]|uniref:homoserine dehydrogenase n=1 Tax=Novosphingobium rosa TaxID=76978 RepID=UPI0008295D2D|nr:homoserine dehydrogenase [Novosphingobium rosa]